MRILLTAKNISNPTLDTIYNYTNRRFQKIRKLIKKTKFDINLAEVKINAEYNKSSRSFSLKAILSIGGKIFIVRIVDNDVRKAIDSITDNLRMQLVESRGKTWLNAHN